MDKVILYGAGKYCERIIAEEVVPRDAILYICDRDPNKWSDSVIGIEIKKPNLINTEQFDYIVVTQSKWEYVAKEIMSTYAISKRRIRVYNWLKNCIQTIDERKRYEAERRIIGKRGVEIVKRGLLSECLAEGEFEGYNRIIIVGKNEDCSIIHDFFENSSGIEVVNEEDIIEMKLSDKFAIIGETYKEDIERLSRTGVQPEQWVLLPFFDVLKTISV